MHSTCLKVKIMSELVEKKNNINQYLHEPYYKHTISKSLKSYSTTGTQESKVYHLKILLLWGQNSKSKFPPSKMCLVSGKEAKNLNFKCKFIPMTNEYTKVMALQNTKIAIFLHFN